ncbi:MAG TPA: prolipoprotein diacylglyceryl transferase [Gemmatimonadales bacterium]|nr:prolipoprotein diacylglyceryl transferase [Gemmatimonadales bacterium]
MTVYPLALHFGWLEVTGYGLMLFVSFYLAGWAMTHELRRRGLDEEYAANIVIAAVIGGLLGAKLWYVALTGDLDALIRRGGFVWYGGFIGGSLAVMFNSWRQRVPIRFTADLVAPALALGYAVGRVGCFLVGDDYGIPTTLPWGVKFPQGLPATTVGNLMQLHVKFPPGTDVNQLVAVHPTEVYETTLMLLVFWWLWRHRDHRHATGWLFSCYLVFAGLERFVIEAFRAKDDRLLGSVTLAQVTSIGLILVGVYLMQRLRTGEPVAPAMFLQRKGPPPSESGPKSS